MIEITEQKEQKKINTKTKEKNNNSNGTSYANLHNNIFTQTIFCNKLLTTFLNNSAR